ncbi:hypothetical protein BDV95DRAFT_563515 [Massariosphaeria phaeospora]|uniref:Uncharacterized protein n=1 Tax=Massariosphaeria phaeospora TaxID=100035 RepID=A0A7C8MQQ2_9PLEO|nr:hypothetical protein BDV95DRAFT_563515 [Massariosphaeria phaeospora]
MPSHITPFTMLPTLIAALVVSSSSVVAAQQEFWWSFKPNHTSDEGYDPSFEICGTSCDGCDRSAKQCFSSEFANICYQPDQGESCCKDQYGTACVDGFYCAYNDKAIAFCCEKDTDVEECGHLFDEDLSRAELAVPTTVIVTEIFDPVATGTASQSIAARPNRTTPPKLPGNVGHTGKDPDHYEDDDGMAVGVRVGIVVGAFVGIAALVALVVFCLMRKRRIRKHPPAVPAKFEAPQVPAKARHPSPFAKPIPQGQGPMPASPTAYEPMRGGPPPSYYQQPYGKPYLVKPVPSSRRSPSPRSQKTGAEVEHFPKELPPRGGETHEMTTRRRGGDLTSLVTSTR